MAFKRTLRALTGVLLVLAVALSGCTTVVWETAKKLHEDRTTESQFTDTRISASVMSGLAEKDLGLFMDVNADVWDARLLLTGTVTDATMRRDVVRQVRSDKRIQKIYNEIQVVLKAEQDKRLQLAIDRRAAPAPDAPASGSDFWIETKIAAKLIAAKDVVSVNYRWRSVRNTLYVIGAAQNKQELVQVLSLIRATDGVARVKSFVEIKPTLVS